MDAGQDSNGEGVNLAEASRRVALFVNGTVHSVQSTMLLSALRGELGFTGAKPGCGEGACGSCTVLVDGETVKACRQEVAGIAGRSVTTVEGLASPGGLHPVQQAFLEVGAAQCGYCTPAMVLAVVALLQRDPRPERRRNRRRVGGQHLPMRLLPADSPGRAPCGRVGRDARRRVEGGGRVPPRTGGRSPTRVRPAGAPLGRGT